MAEFDEEALAQAYETALKLEKSGDIDAAAEAWRAVLALDPLDHGGAAVRLAALGRGDTPDRASPAYVETLFDQHAEAFDDILVDQLGYAVPLMLHQALLDHAPGPYARGLDLGCGTGLTGGALSDMVSEFIGIDVSENMVAMAEDRDVYDGLYVGDVVEFMEEVEDEAPWDLIAATDLLPYLGALERFFRSASARLNPGGVLGFSTETLPDEVMAGRTYMVGPGKRFAHAETYIRDLLDANGLMLLHITPIVVRHEEGQPVPGHLVLARKG